jgi:nicotinamide riboside kinase
MLRINFYGGPCVGKSTLAARVYAELNRTQRVPTELVREFVKSWAYEGRRLDVFDQVFTFANQLWNEHRLFKASVKVIVTDSPILLQCVYTRRLDASIASYLAVIAQEYERTHPSLSFLVERGETPFNSFGRYQESQQARDLDAEIKGYLNAGHVPYLAVTLDQWETIIQTVKEAVYSS